MKTRELISIGFFLIFGFYIVITHAQTKDVERLEDQIEQYRIKRGK
jgi:hypothetical protein